MTEPNPLSLEERVERLSSLLREEGMTGLDFRLHQSSDETGEYYVTEATIFCDQNARVMDLINATGDWSDTTLALFCTAVNLAPELIAERSSFANALEMTGCTSEEELIDMANVGRSTMDRMAEVVENGPLKGWSPADDPAEIITDLANKLDDALHDYGNAESECKLAEARNEELEAALTEARREVSELREGLRPLAVAVEDLDGHGDGWFIPTGRLNIGHGRRAADLVQRGEQPGGGEGANLTASNEELIAQAMEHPPVVIPAPATAALANNPDNPPEGFRRLPAGVRCRCIRMWRGASGNHYCCRPGSGGVKP